MRYLRILALACVALIAGCATVDYQPYEGKTNLYEGTGGTKVVVDGVEFWANGTPPRKYSILGIVVSEIGAGVGDEAIVRTTVAKEVQQRGGNAAIQMSNNSSFGGLFQTSTGALLATNVKSMRFAVIKYVE